MAIAKLNPFQQHAHYKQKCKHNEDKVEACCLPVTGSKVAT